MSMRILAKLSLVPIYALLLVAPLVVVLYSFSPGVVLRFPPDRLTLRWYANLVDQPRLLDGIWTSLLVGGSATLMALVIGVPVAYALARGRLPAHRAVTAFFLSPLSLPGLVLGLSLLMMVSAVVQPLTRVPLLGTSLPLLAAHLLITTPWIVRTVSANLEGTDPALEDAARGLGATPVEAFFLVTLPAIRPGLVAAATFAFIVSFGNFSLSLFFSTGRITTLPVAIFEYMDRFQDPTVAAASALVILGSTLVVLVADRSVGALSARVDGGRNER